MLNELDGENRSWDEFGLSQIFTPDSPVEDADRLIGRREELRGLLAALAEHRESVPVLCGPPGIGKTSLLNICAQVLVGFDGSLESMGLSQFRLRDAPRLVLWVRCDHRIATPSALASIILEQLRSAVASNPEARTFHVREFSVKSSVKFLEVAATWDRNASAPRDSPERELGVLLSQLTRDSGITTYIMLDECEHLPWLDEMVGFMRQFEAPGVQFLLAMRDYAVDFFRTGPYDDYRWPILIDVARLDDRRVKEFFASAEQKLSMVGVRLDLNPRAFSEIFRVSLGEPWYLQMIGSELLLARSEQIVDQLNREGECRMVVTGEQVRAAEQALIRKRLQPSFGGLYLAVTTGASRREEVLRTIAAVPDTVITPQLLSFLKRHRGGDPRRVVERLTSRNFGPVLVPSRSIIGGWEFASHQFRVYCRLAEPSSALLGHLVQEAVHQWEISLGA